MMKVMVPTLMLVQMDCMSRDLDTMLGKYSSKRLASTDGEVLHWMERTEQSANQGPQRRMKLVKAPLRLIQCRLYRTIPG